MKIEDSNRLAEYRRCIDKFLFSKPKLERENGFKTLKGDKNQISEKSQRSAEEHTHNNQQNNQQESNLWLLCG